MARTKLTQKTKRSKNDTSDDSNQKNNWVVQKLGVTLDEFLELRSKLFRQTKNGDFLLRNNTFFSFAAISYFWYDPSEDDSEHPSDCVRLLRIFIQLQNRKILDDVEEELGIADLEEYGYDPLEDDDTAVPIDAKKALYAIIGNSQNMAFAGILRVKGAGTKAGIAVGGYTAPLQFEKGDKNERIFNESKVPYSPQRPKRDKNTKTKETKNQGNDTDSVEGYFAMSSEDEKPTSRTRKREKEEDEESVKLLNNKKQKIEKKYDDLVSIVKEIQETNMFLVNQIEVLSRDKNNLESSNRAPTTAPTVAEPPMEQQLITVEEDGKQNTLGNIDEVESKEEEEDKINEDSLIQPSKAELEKALAKAVTEQNWEECAKISDALNQFQSITNPPDMNMDIAPHDDDYDAAFLLPYATNENERCISYLTSKRLQCVLDTLALDGKLDEVTDVYVTFLNLIRKYLKQNDANMSIPPPNIESCIDHDYLKELILPICQNEEEKQFIVILGESGMNYLSYHLLSSKNIDEGLDVLIKFNDLCVRGLKHRNESY